MILSPCENIHDLFEPASRFDIVHGRSTALGRDFLTHIHPDVVAAPVMGQDHDILEIGQILRDLAFTGQLCAVSKPPIKANLVMTELRRACPGLRVCLVELDSR